MTTITMGTRWSTQFVVLVVTCVLSNAASIWIIPGLVMQNVERDYVRKDVADVVDKARTTLVEERLKYLGEQMIDLRVQVGTMQREQRASTPR